jgi:hypothetical protein
VLRVTGDADASALAGATSSRAAMAAQIAACTRAMNMFCLLI